MSSFDLATGKVVPVGTNGISASGVHPDSNNVAPRIGIAWRPGAGLVVRGGYGIYYDSSMFEVGSAQYFNPPQFTLRVYFPTQYSLLTLANPFPSNGGIAPPASLSALDPDLVSSFMQHWNVSVQRPVGPFGVLTVSYAGSKGTNLLRARDLNQPPPGPGDVQSRRPYPGLRQHLLRRERRPLDVQLAAVPAEPAARARPGGVGRLHAVEVDGRRVVVPRHDR